MLFLTTLGDLSLSAPDGEIKASGIKPLVILAILARSPKFTAKREYVAQLLWPDSARSRALASLRQALHELNGLGCTTLIQTTNGELNLDSEEIEVDLWAFDRAVEEGRYLDLHHLYRGPFLSGFRGRLGRELEHWAEAEESRIEVALNLAAEKGIRSAVQANSFQEAVDLARNRVALSPFSDKANLALLEALESSGRLLEAMQLAKEFRVSLDRELGDSPTPEFDAAEERIARRFAQQEQAEKAPPRVEATSRVPPSPSLPASAERTGPWFPSLMMFALFATVLAAALGFQFLGGPGGDFTVHLAGGDGSGGRGIVTITQDGLSFLPEEDWTDRRVWSPVNSTVAFEKEGPTGPDVFVRYPDGRELAVVTSRSDDHPVTFSPDGRQLLYSRGWLNEASGAYEVVLGVGEPEGEKVEFPVPGATDAIRAAWSPNGTRIAASSWTAALWLYDPTGRLVQEASLEESGKISVQGWCPDSRRVLTVISDGRGARASVFDPGAGQFRDLDQVPGEASSATWITRKLAVVISSVGDQVSAFLVDVDGGDMAVLDADSPVTGFQPGSMARTDEGSFAVISPEDVFPSLPWEPQGAVDSIRITGPSFLASPGEFLSYKAMAVDERGELVHLPNTDFRWASEDPFSEPISPGLFQILGEGTAVISVEIPGFRLTSHQIPVRTPERSELTPVFSEDWSSGISTNWVAYGDPRPVLVMDAAAGGGPFFLNNGDQNHVSGIASRDFFPMGQGLTIEVKALTPFTGDHFQDWFLGLATPEMIPEPIPDSWGWRGPWIVGLFGGASETVFWDSATQTSVPLPSDLGDWRTFDLQVNADGCVALLVDGLVHRRTQRDVSGLRDGAAVVLGGNSLGTRILHDAIKVYPGEVYDISCDPLPLGDRGTADEKGGQRK